MNDQFDKDLDTKWIKRILIGMGSVFVVAGLIRQWPVFGKTYMEFIEGKGYMALTMGLIMIVLGSSVRLLMGQADK